MRSVFAITMLAAAVAAAAPTLPPSLSRFETVGATNLQARVGTPYVAPGKVKEYFIYGQWMDWASSVTLDGIPQTIVEKKALFNSDGGLLRVKLTVPPGTDRGIRTLVVRVGCPPIPFTDCRNVTFSRNVMVLRVGSVSSITPSSGVTATQSFPFNVSGSGLDVAALHFRTHIRASGTPMRSASTFGFTGTPVCGMNVVMLRDEAEGGDVYPYSGVLNVYTTTQCGYQAPPRIGSPSSGCPAGQTFNTTTQTCS
jgi:hypothetical protein